tara:strand:- start:1138 stop:1665 length:528 start_codon:yes stop_codon:yes gene_type:complete
MSNKRPSSIGRQRSKPFSIRLPVELNELLDEIAAKIDETHDLKLMLHNTPKHLANPDREPKNGRALKPQIIEYIVFTYINDFIRQFTPSIKPFHPYDNGNDAVNHHHDHLINIDKAIIEKGMNDHPYALDILPIDPRELPNEKYLEISYYAGFFRLLNADKSGREPGAHTQKLDP